MNQIACAHGTITVVEYRLPWRIEEYRTDGTWRLDGGRDSVHEKSMCAGPGDISPRHASYPNGYDARCGCCWLGITHTEDRHAREIRS